MKPGSRIFRNDLLAVLLTSALLVSACGGGADALTASLSWDASPSDGVTGYRVYVGTASRSYDAPGSGVYVGATTSYKVSGLARGQTYYFAVTAVDAAGNESLYSNEVSKPAQ